MWRTSDHWAEVQAIITDAVKSISNPKFSVRLVSSADDIGVIQKRIVQNLYTDEIIVCDVSAKNPNVMFELGMRLAFDKATVIVKDDKTTYSFDTSSIEHLEYPRDLRFTKIVQFKEQLATKVLATYQASKSDPKHSTFLKHFGTFQVAKLNQETVSLDKLMIDQLAQMQAQLNGLQRLVINLDSSARKAILAEDTHTRNLLTTLLGDKYTVLSPDTQRDYFGKIRGLLNADKPNVAKEDE
jgi:hypothetical protein